MKTIFRNLGLGILMAGCVVVTGTQAFAQDAPAADVCKEIEPQQALYKQFTDNIPPTVAKPTVEQTETAIKAGDEYVQKYGACPDSKTIVDYFKQYLPGMKKGVEDQKAAAIKQVKAQETGKLLARFDAALKANNNQGNPAEIYASGKDIVALNDEFALDVLLVLGTVGFDQSNAKPPVDTYNEDAIKYAKQAIQKLEADTPSKTGSYGVLQYSYKNKTNPDGKNNALNWMNYNIGYITYYRQGKDNPAKKKEALPYLYNATKYASLNQKNPTPYQAIGAWYLDEAIRVDKERTAILETNGKKDNEQTLAMVGEQKGYADRAIDAYSRAYKLAKAAPTPDKTYTDSLYTRLTELYKFRYDGKIEGIDQFVATVDSKPFPDPTTKVTPVNVEPTDTTTTTTGANTPTTDTTKPVTTVKPTTPTVKPTINVRPTTPATTVKPTTTTKPATGATKPAGTANVDAATTTNGKAVVKTTTPKKKGTR
ncbi:MAG: hypothetical protein M3T96_09375 [Acidobacteriota bacterium]|nr:hypothetical protein [Acidobacteriota bacterium]